MINSYRPLENLKISEFVYKTDLAGLFYIAPKKFDDERGFYAEVARVPELEQAAGQPFAVAQINHSRSLPNVIRGFHAEDWNKLITVTSGQVLSVIVDIRPGSPTFGQHQQFLLGYEGEALGGSIFVSRGLANGFLVMQGPADYLYAVDALYAERDKSKDQALALFDPDLGIEWPVAKQDLIYSQRDEQGLTLSQLAR